MAKSETDPEISLFVLSLVRLKWPKSEERKMPIELRVDYGECGWVFDFDSGARIRERVRIRYFLLLSNLIFFTILGISLSFALLITFFMATIFSKFETFSFEFNFDVVVGG